MPGTSRLGRFGDLPQSVIRPEPRVLRVVKPGKTLLFASARDLHYDWLLLQSLKHPSLKAVDVVIQCHVTVPSLSFDYPPLGTLQHVLNSACDAQVVMQWSVVHTDRKSVV